MSPLARVSSLLAVAITAGASPVQGQDAPLILEVHGGGVVPVGSFQDGSGPGEGTTAGSSLAVTFAIPSAGRRTLYAGFSQHRFGCEDAGCQPGGRYVATGFNVGLRFALLQRRGTIPWIRIGAITTRVETGDLPGADAGVSDLGFGGEIGFGVHIGANRAVALSPMLLASAIDSELPGGSTLSLRYLTAQLGVAVSF